MSAVEPLSPWAEGKGAEPRWSALFGAVPAPEALSEVARQRVAQRLRRGAPRRMGLTMLRLIALGAVLGMAGAAAAQWASVRLLGAQAPYVTRYPRAVTPEPQPAPPRGTRAKARALEPSAVQTDAPQQATSAAFPTPSASSRSSSLGQEAASLANALSALKAGGPDNAARALRALDRHLREFAQGPLELEARVARVDALLVLGRRQEARRELSALPIESVGRKHELRLIRAELRADDDCRAAISDFQVLVELPLPTAWAERALFGRGACLLKLGDKAGAERDFTRYLERFPAGRFAEQIRAQAPR
jgi:hypothetical protein